MTDEEMIVYQRQLCQARRRRRERQRARQRRRRLRVAFLLLLGVLVAVFLEQLCENGQAQAQVKEEITAPPTVSAQAQAAPQPTNQVIEAPALPAETPVPAQPAPEPEPVPLYDVPLERELQEHIIGVCQERGIDPAVLLAMIQTESQYRADVMGDGGKAYGLMQIHPQWHSGRMERLGVTDLLNPFENVVVGADYLTELTALYDGNVEMALVAYNAGPQGAENGWFSVGVYSSDYSRKVLATAAEIGESLYEG